MLYIWKCDNGALHLQNRVQKVYSGEKYDETEQVRWTLQCKMKK